MFFWKLNCCEGRAQYIAAKHKFNENHDENKYYKFYILNLTTN